MKDGQSKKKVTDKDYNVKIVVFSVLFQTLISQDKAFTQLELKYDFFLEIL